MGVVSTGVTKTSVSMGDITEGESTEVSCPLFALLLGRCFAAGFAFDLLPLVGLVGIGVGFNTGAVGTGAGTQFITGPCVQDSDCASGCCAGRVGSETAACSAVLVANDDGKTGCGFGS